MLRNFHSFKGSFFTKSRLACFTTADKSSDAATHMTTDVKKQQRGVAHVFNDSTDVVPEVHREFRHIYSQKPPADLNGYRR